MRYWLLASGIFVHLPNPFKPGEMMNVKAKPASTKIKVRALGGLKGLS